MTSDRDPWFSALLERAGQEPLGIDIADFSDEFCDGFLAGQVNALEHLARLREDDPCACVETCGDSDPDGPGVCKGLAAGAQAAARGHRSSATERLMTVHVIDCAHYTVDGLEQDKLGFFVPKCACGWQSPPSPDEETATDFLMQHAYEAGILTERHRRAADSQAKPQP